ncbi:MAG: hypothetical protein J6Y57_01420 [Lachnospiraceae bacterium]|nr:hypothetical protein [Lachnospiraceae bacterium]
MKAGRTRVLSVILALSMVFSTPFSVAAEEEGQDLSGTEAEVVLQDEDGAAYDAEEDLLTADEPQNTENDVTLTWEVRDGRAYAVLTGSLPDGEVSESDALPVSVAVRICRKHEADAKNGEETPYAEDETLFAGELSEAEDGTLCYEVPVSELDPGVYVLVPAEEGETAADEALTGAEFHVVYEFDDDEDAGVLSVEDNVFYVPYALREQNEETEAEDTPDAANAEQDADGTSEAEDAGQDADGTPEAEDAGQNPADTEDTADGTENGTDQTDPAAEDGSVQTEDAAEETPDQTEDEPELLTQPAPSGISLSYVNYHRLSVNLDGPDNAEADVWIVMNDRKQYGGFHLYGISKLTGCKKSTNGTEANFIDLESIKAPAGKWYLFAVVLEPGAQTFGSSQVVCEKPFLFYVPEIPAPESIGSATPGGSNGSFCIFSTSPNKYQGVDASPGRIKYGKAESDEAGYNKDNLPNQNVTGLSAGTYRVRFESQYLSSYSESGTVQGAFAAASEYRTFIIPEREPDLETIELMDGNQPVANPGTLLMSKGQTKLFPVRFNSGVENKQPENVSVTYESTDPGTVSVDDAGNIKALKATDNTPVVITVTARSKTYSTTKTAQLFVLVYGPLQIKLAKATVTSDIHTDTAIGFTLPKGTGLSASDISVTSSNPAVWAPTEPLHPGSFHEQSGAGAVVIPAADINGPGRTIVTIRVNRDNYVGEAACTVNLDGIADPGSENMIVCKGGVKQTGWIYLNETEDAVVAKAKAKHIYYIDPATGKPVNGIVKIGKSLWCFISGELVTGREGKGGYDSGKTVFYCKDGRLLTGWQGPNNDKRYYDPATALLIKDSILPFGKGLTYVDTDGKKYVTDGLHEMLPGGDYYMKNGIFKTGWIYLDEYNHEIAKNKAVRWLYADPLTGVILDKDKTVLTIGGKSYFIEKDRYIHEGICHKDGFVDADTNLSCPSFGDYYVGKDGVIVTNKKVTVDGKTYYLDAAGHPRSGLFYDGSRVVMTNGNGEEVQYSSETGLQFYICKQDNSGSEWAFAEQEEKGGIRFYDSEMNTLKAAWLRTGDSSNKDKAGYYYLDKNGKMVKGFQNIDGKRYYFDENTGVLQVGAFKSGAIDTSKDVQIAVKGKYYLVNNEEVESGGFPGRIYYKEAGMKGRYNKPYTYWVDANGVCLTGWRTEEGEKYYFDSDGLLQYLDVFLNGKRYAINPANGRLRTFTFDHVEKTGDHITGVIQKDGTYKTGWIYIGADRSTVQKKPTASSYTYYADPNGNILDEAKYLYRIDGRYYSVYRSNDNYMICDNWKFIENPTVEDPLTGDSHTYTGKYVFRFDKSGAALTGKQKISGYVPKIAEGRILLEKDADGDSVLALRFSVSDLTMFFAAGEGGVYPPGALILDETVSLPDGSYALRSNGTINTGEPGWMDAGKTMYRLDDGRIAAGRTQIGDAWYYFDPVSGKLQKNCIRLSGKKWYLYNEKGQQAQLTAFIPVIGDPAVTAEYASDGSITCFKYVADGKKAANTAIQMGGTETVVIGGKGLPQTGIAKHATGSYYYDADGRPHPTGGKETIMKIGKKYYMCKDGKLLAGLNPIMAFDESLSDTDRRILAMYNRLRSSCTIMELFCTTGTDGSVLSNTIAPGESTYGSFYGTVLEVDDMVLFCKKGGRWCVPVRTIAGEDTVELIGGTSFTATRRWGKDGLLKGLYDADGKALTGVYRYYAGVGSNKIQVEICLKNGKPVTGKQTIADAAGFKTVKYFDADCGVRYDNEDPIL